MSRKCLAAAALVGLLLVPAIADDGGKLPFGKDYDAGLETAKTTGKPILVYFTADW